MRPAAARTNSPNVSPILREEDRSRHDAIVEKLNALNDDGLNRFLHFQNTG